MDVAIAQYAPDQPPLETGVSRNMLNVLPLTKASVAPCKSLQPVTDALAARCQGAASMRSTNGTIKTFAGTATALFFQDGTALTDATRTVGGAYATPDYLFWEMIKYGNLCVAVNGVDAAQKFAINTDTNFSALGGSPPIARHLAVWGNYLVMGNLSTDNTKIHWSGTDDPESWTAGTDNSGTQGFPDGGEVMKITNAPLRLIFLERAIHRATEVGGDDVFQFDQISAESGCAASGSVAQFQDLVFYLSREGFMMVSNAGFRPIGSQRVDKTFFADVNTDYLFRITATCDPTNKLYRVCYPSTGSTTCNKMLIYNWEQDLWTPAAYNIEYLRRSHTEVGVTLEDLDALYPGGLESIPISLDSPVFNSTPQETLAAFNTDHKLAVFDGANLAVTIESVKAQIIPGQKAKVLEARCHCDGGLASEHSMVLVIHNDKLNDSVRTTNAVTQRSTGRFPFANKRSRGRIHAVRHTVAAGATWSKFQGWDFTAQPTGQR
jgi:hypothetical protein